MTAPAKTPLPAQSGPKSGFPLRPTLVTVVVFLIFFGSGAVGILAYRSSSESIATLWNELSAELAHRTTQRTIRYLEPAEPYMELTRRLAGQWRLDTSDSEALLDYFYAAMEANPQFTWVSHASPGGRYIAVHRTPEGELVGHDREQMADGTTAMRELSRNGSVWTLADEETGSYDPRERPWFQAAIEKGEGTWVEPFLFATINAPGFMYVAPDGDGGVWAVEYEMSALSEFLSTVKVGEHGKVYVVSMDGHVVGHPEGMTTAEADGEKTVAMADDHEDPMLASAWGGLRQHEERPASFQTGANLVMVDAFPEDSGIPWQTVIVVPESDFFGALRDQAKRAAIVASVAALLSVILGIFFANRVSGSLRIIADELGRIGRFELGDAKLPRSSLVREVNDMAEATDAMKSSLKSFGRYVPKDLVSEMLRTGTEAVLGGEKKELTMLFSDIAGFTSVAESMEPDELVELLADYLEAMSGCIKDHDGTVDKFIGDAIMAFWGAPRDLEDHAARACRAALSMRATLTRLQKEWEEVGRPHFETRIGLNTGDTVVGNIGASERLNYTVMGDAVNLASRLENLNKAYGTRILCGDETKKAAGDGFVFRAVDWVAVKGKKRGILIHELIGEVDEVLESEKDAVDAYRQALDLYRARKFAEAAEAFDAAAEAFGGEDGPSRTMAERARTYAEAPPPDDWDGTHVMTSK